MDDELQRFRESWLYHATVFLFEHMQRCALSLICVNSHGSDQNSREVCYTSRYTDSSL